MKALVLGLGISGQSAVHFLEKRGWSVATVDDKINPNAIHSLEGFDLFVPSPGIPRTHSLYQSAVQLHIPIKGELELALEEIHQPCIGVTGSNGKTTVVKMIEHCLNACGKKAKAVGNVGEPLTSHVGNPEEILIIEISSFQLETMHAKSFEIGFILNITENHMDRYDSFREYALTKAHLHDCIKDSLHLYVHESVDPSLFTKPYSNFQGENAEAARLACSYFGINSESFFSALRSFKKPPHRIEYVAQINQVNYYNDSKATSVVAMIHALKTMKGKVVLLAGGKDKGLSFEPLCSELNNVSNVIVFGSAREKIAAALGSLVKIHKVLTVEEAIEKAVQIAQPHENVLFSPGCASYDAYKNYEERGEEFKRSVLRRVS